MLAGDLGRPSATQLPLPTGKIDLQNHSTPWICPRVDGRSAGDGARPGSPLELIIRYDRQMANRELTATENMPPITAKV